MRQHSYLILPCPAASPCLGDFLGGERGGVEGKKRSVQATCKEVLCTAQMVEMGRGTRKQAKKRYSW